MLTMQACRGPISDRVRRASSACPPERRSACSNARPACHRARRAARCSLSGKSTRRSSRTGCRRRPRRSHGNAVGASSRALPRRPGDHSVRARARSTAIRTSDAASVAKERSRPARCRSLAMLGRIRPDRRRKTAPVQLSIATGAGNARCGVDDSVDTRHAVAVDDHYCSAVNAPARAARSSCRT